VVSKKIVHVLVMRLGDLSQFLQFVKMFLFEMRIDRAKYEFEPLRYFRIVTVELTRFGHQGGVYETQGGIRNIGIGTDSQHRVRNEIADVIKMLVGPVFDESEDLVCWVGWWRWVWWGWGWVSVTRWVWRRCAMAVTALQKVPFSEVPFFEVPLCKKVHVDI